MAMADLGIGAMLGVFAGAILLFVIIAIAVYVFQALAWMTIAKKLNYDKGWLAWIPVANFFLLPILAKKHWAWGFIVLAPIILGGIPVLGTLVTLAVVVFSVIWMWNIFEQRKFPGWLSIIYLIPIVNLVILGVVAWSGKGKAAPKTKEVKPKKK